MSKYTRECASRVDVEINNHKVQSSIAPTKLFFSVSEKRDAKLIPEDSHLVLGIHIDASSASAHKLQPLVHLSARLSFVILTFNVIYIVSYI